MKILILILFLSFSAGAGTKECREDPDFYKYLTGTIGSGDEKKPFTYLMPCDTMYINKGVTVIINKNTYLAFADPKTDNVLIVQGTLIVKGTQQYNVRISSSLDTVLLSPTGLKSPWWGISVENRGSLVFDNVMMYGAYIPVKINSKEVRIENSIFFGGNQIYVEGMDNYKIRKDGYVKSFSMEDYLMKFVGTSTETDQAQPEKKPKKKKSFWSSPWPYIGGGAVLIGGGVIAAGLLYEPEDKVVDRELGTLDLDM
jgi:hypothetical protein